MNAAVNDKVVIRVGGHTYSGTVLYCQLENVYTHLLLLDDNQIIVEANTIKVYLPHKSSLAAMVHSVIARRKLRRILDKTEGPKYLAWIPDWDILSVYEESNLTLKEMINQLNEEVL